MRLSPVAEKWSKTPQAIHEIEFFASHNHLSTDKMIEIKYNKLKKVESVTLLIRPFYLKMHNTTY